MLRPTWHFVTPADIRWMLALTGPRLNRSHVPYHGKLGLGEKVLRRSRAVIERALRDGTQLTRAVGYLSSKEVLALLAPKR